MKQTVVALFCSLLTMVSQAQCFYSTGTSLPAGYRSVLPTAVNNLATNADVPTAQGWFTIPSPALQAPLIAGVGNRVANASGTGGNGTYRIFTPNFFYDQPNQEFLFFIAVNTDLQSNSVSLSFSNVKLYFGTTPTAVSFCSVAASTYTQSKNTTIYYSFTFMPGPLYPASTNFRIGMDVTVSGQAGGTNRLYIADFGLNGDTQPKLASGVLPVRIASFTARPSGNSVQLNWTAGEEQLVEQYEIQKSADGIHFSSIGTIASTQQAFYRYEDQHPWFRTWYRIMAKEKDGGVQYSSTVMVRTEQATALQASQDAVGTIRLQYETASEGDAISIYSSLGQCLTRIQPPPGSIQRIIDIKNPAGLLFIHYRRADGRESLVKLFR